MGVGLSLLGLQARAQLPALNPQDVQSLLRFVLPRHALARAAPAHTPKCTLICARTRLPPRSASYLPRRRSWGRTPEMQGTVRPLERRLDQPVPQPGTLPGDAAPAAHRPGVGTWTPGLRSVPPRLSVSSHWRPEAWSLGAGLGRGLLRMRSGEAVSPRGLPIRLARNWEGVPDPALLPPHSSAVRDRRASRDVGCLARHWP